LAEPLASALTEAHVLSLDAVNPHFTLVTPKTVELATDLALDVNVWTVNEPEDIRAMAAMGVASIITDQPALAMQLLTH
jgi:glycerophosphoryl diester phosphodiesterase